MANRCPHCGTNLPMIHDAFCPECRNNLSGSPPQGQIGNHPTGSDPSFPGLWRATEDRVFRLTKMSWYDDRGSIDALPAGLLFRGQREDVVLGRISAVEHMGPVVPWMGIVSLMVGDVLVLVMVAAGMLQNFTLESPGLYLLLLALNLLALAIWPMRWVRVDYLGEDHKPSRAYFTASSVLERWTGGPERLCTFLRRQSGPG